MANNGKQFEVLLEEIYSTFAQDDKYTTVKRNVFLEGPDGPRQFDLVLRGSIAGHNITTVVECRDHKYKLDVNSVGEFHSKLTDVNASHGVLVARKGFTDGAKKKAKRHGISLCRVSEAAEVLSSLEFVVPVAVSEFFARFHSVQGDLDLPAEFNPSAAYIVNNKWLPEVFNKEIMTGSFPFPIEGGIVPWVPKTIKPPYFVRDKKGRRHTLHNPTFSAQVMANHYFGYVDDLPKAIAIHNLSNSSAHVIIKLGENSSYLSDDLYQLKRRLTRIRSRDKIPDVDACSIFSLVALDEKRKDLVDEIVGSRSASLKGVSKKKKRTVGMTRTVKKFGMRVVLETTKKPKILKRISAEYLRRLEKIQKTIR